MSKELKFEFNDYIIAIDEPYEKDCGYVAIGKKDTKGNINIWFKSPNEQTVDFYIELQKHITDLEAKLAESKESCILLEGLRKSEAEKKDIAMKRVVELKQQLAEKEKEIEELKQRLKDTIKIYSDDFVEKDKELKELRFQARNIFPLVENLEEKIYQDKISFAVEQLEKARSLLFDAPYEFDSEEWCWIEHQISNQIAELKKGNK